jgi:hypothetical protein
MTQKTHQVTLTPPSGTTGWLMSLDGGNSQGPGSYPAISVGKGDKADITYTIKNGPGQNVTFAINPILVPPKVNDLGNPAGGGGSITINDTNQNKGDIPYSLVFNEAPKLDPIIQNGGCCSFQSGFSRPVELSGGELALYLVVAFVAGMIAMMGLRAMKKRA